MLAGVVVLGLLAVVWLFSQQTSMADAPGHCERATSEMGTSLSYDEILTLAQNAGFSCDAPVAVAIALAESGGDPEAYNPEKNARLGYEDAPDGKGSFGLWQIYLHKHPEFEGLNLLEPQTNANAAFKVYSDAGSFHPWSTYKSGKYQEYLNA